MKSIAFRQVVAVLTTSLLLSAQTVSPSDLRTPFNQSVPTSQLSLQAIVPYLWSQPTISRAVSGGQAGYWRALQTSSTIIFVPAVLHARASALMISTDFDLVGRFGWLVGLSTLAALSSGFGYLASMPVRISVKPVRVRIKVGINRANSASAPKALLDVSSLESRDAALVDALRLNDITSLDMMHYLTGDTTSAPSTIIQRLLFEHGSHLANDWNGLVGVATALQNAPLQADARRYPTSAIVSDSNASAYFLRTLPELNQRQPLGDSSALAIKDAQTVWSMYQRNSKVYATPAYLAQVAGSMGVLRGPKPLVEYVTILVNQIAALAAAEGQHLQVLEIIDDAGRTKELSLATVRTGPVTLRMTIDYHFHGWETTGQALIVLEHVRPSNSKWFGGRGGWASLFRELFWNGLLRTNSQSDEFLKSA